MRAEDAGFKAAVDTYTHQVDAFRYLVEAYAAKLEAYKTLVAGPPPPPPDPSWPIEQQEAHKALFAPPTLKFRRYNPDWTTEFPAPEVPDLIPLSSGWSAMESPSLSPVQSPSPAKPLPLRRWRDRLRSFLRR